MHMQSGKNLKTTSWGGVADWYDDYMGKEGTYQKEVILPNLLRILGTQKNEIVLDLACGQGFFSHEMKKAGFKVTGADISPELIAEAKRNVPGVDFYVTSADLLTFAKAESFDMVVCILAIQNIENIASVFTEVRRVLKQSGRCILVMNHPAFRVLKRSSWQWDEEQKVQYRRIDGYLSQAKVIIEMHPGAEAKKQTISYHRSLQDFFKTFSKAGFTVSRLEEWVSHKVSEKGPRQKAEDVARKEIPLFMMIEARRI